MFLNGLLSLVAAVAPISTCLPLELAAGVSYGLDGGRGFDEVACEGGSCYSHDSSFEAVGR